MAIMTEDIINKAFTATELRRGYDENEVDDFLDQIVVELGRLTNDNDELRELIPPEALDKVEAARFSAEKAEKDAVARIAKANEDAQQAVADAQAAVAEAAERAQAAMKAADDIAGSALAVGLPAARNEEWRGDGEVSGAAAENLGSASGVLTLAHKLHDEYVSEGLNTRERLISEGQLHHDEVVGEATSRHDELVSTGQAQHDELVSTGQARHDELLSVGEAKHDELIAEADAMVAKATANSERIVAEAGERSTAMVAEAQQKRAEVFQALAYERSLLQKEIEELQTFARDQRAHMMGYHEGQLIALQQAGTEQTGTEQTDTEQTGTEQTG